MIRLCFEKLTHVSIQRTNHWKQVWIWRDQFTRCWYFCGSSKRWRRKECGGGVVKMERADSADSYLGGKMDKIWWYARNGGVSEEVGFSVGKDKRNWDEAEMSFSEDTCFCHFCFWFFTHSSPSLTRGKRDAYEVIYVIAKMQERYEMLRFPNPRLVSFFTRRTSQKEGLHLSFCISLTNLHDT